MIKNLSKKTIFFALALVTVIAATGITTAILKAESGSLTNTFKLASIDTSIEEEVKVDEGELIKVVRIKNQLDPQKTKSYAMVRVRLTVSPEDVATCDTPAKDSGSHWLFNEADGFWYYTRPLAPGEYTETLMTQVNINESMVFQEGDVLDVTVYEEACAVTQVEEFMALNKEKRMQEMQQIFLEATNK